MRRRSWSSRARALRRELFSDELLDELMLRVDYDGVSLTGESGFLPELINVWVVDWQTQCCGSRFADGDLADWALLTQNDVAWLESVAGDAARSVEFSWEKHGPLPEGSSTASGVVASIRAV